MWHLRFFRLSFTVHRPISRLYYYLPSANAKGIVVEKQHTLNPLHQHSRLLSVCGILLGSWIFSFSTLVAQEDKEGGETPCQRFSQENEAIIAHCTGSMNEVYPDLLKENKIAYRISGENQNVEFSISNGTWHPIGDFNDPTVVQEFQAARASLSSSSPPDQEQIDHGDKEQPGTETSTESNPQTPPATAPSTCTPIQDPKLQKELAKDEPLPDDPEDWVVPLSGIFSTNHPAGSQHMQGSQIFSRCQALVTHNWRQGTPKQALDDNYWHEAWFNIGRENIEGRARNKNSYDYLANINKAWNELKEASDNFYGEKKRNPDCPNEAALTGLLSGVEKARKKLAAQLEKALDNAMKDANEIGLCAALMIMMEGTNYDDDSLSTPHSKVSLDQRIVCKTRGFETQDFSACANIINLYDASVFGEQGMSAVQEIDYAGTASSAQFNYGVNPDDPTSALKAQKKTVQKRADITKQRAIFHGAKLGSLIALYNSMPTHEDILARCDNYGKNRVSALPEANFKKFSQLLQKIADEAHLAPEKKYDSYNLPRPDYCGDIITGEKNSADLIMNTKAKDAIKAIMVEAGIEVGKNAMFAKVLGDQAKDLQEAIDKVKEIDVTNAGSGYGSMLVHKCQVMPDHPDCLGSGFGGGYASSATGGGYNINYNDTGDTTVGGKYVEPETPQENAANNLSPKDYSAPIPGVEQAAGKNPTGIADASSRAGRKSANTPNGAGGGGAPGGMSPPGGGGGNYGGGGGGGGGGRGSDSSLQYGKEAGSSAFYSGGGGGNGKEESKETKNPFADLFNKDGKNTSTNVRNLASIGPQELDLFVRLNQRYSEVQKEDRLLKVDRENDVIK